MTLHQSHTSYYFEVRRHYDGGGNSLVIMIRYNPYNVLNPRFTDYLGLPSREVALVEACTKLVAQRRQRGLRYLLIEVTHTETELA